MPDATPADAFHTALEAAVRGSSDLATAMGTGGKGILVEVPVDQKPPYVLLGETQILLENGDCADEAEVFATVHVWSRLATPDKGAQARAMGAAIVAALNVELTVTGWDVDVWSLQSESYSPDPDQSTHGVLVFHYLLTEQVA